MKEIKIQYLYDDGVNMCFMNIETYETLEVSSDDLSWEKNFLVEDLILTAIVEEHKIQKIILPKTVRLRVVECEGPSSLDPSILIVKKAVIETGFTVHVPLFIGVNDVIAVSTKDGSYVDVL